MSVYDDPSIPALERAKLQLERDRLAQAKELAGGFSGATVTLFGTLVALLSAAVTALISGYFQAAINEKSNEAEIAVQRLIAEAQRDRLATEQRFEIIVQATKGLPRDVAAENLVFFVDAGILADPEGRIAALAREGGAPLLATAQENPLQERVASLRDRAERPADPATEASAPDIVDGVIRSRSDLVVDYVETPNHGTPITPRYVVIHATLASADSTVHAMTSSNVVRASYHAVVRRDGSIVQLLPLDFKAWHAGSSSWGSISGLNDHSVGISFENRGALERRGDAWVDLYGRVVPDDEVEQHEGRGWHVFTADQIRVAEDIVRAIVQQNPEITDVLGHSDISPDKQDPGPAFPIRELRSQIFGREDPLPPPG